MKSRIFLFLGIFLLFPSFLFGEAFAFQYNQGNKYRIVSKVNEDVIINGIYSHTSDILNKISITVEESADGRGLLDADFQTSERSAGNTGVYQWGQFYHSRFYRDMYGKYEISSKFFMPVVRDVPTFPERDIQPGDSWSAEGHEVHDFRTNFGIPEPYRFPILVHYTYLGKEKKNGATYDLISIYYTVYYRTDAVVSSRELYPVRITGYSEQLLYWDNDLGRPDTYNENFEFLFILSDGQTVEYRGTADAETIQASSLDKNKVSEEIREQLKETVPEARVEAGEEGVTITLENIQFLPDSAVLLKEEQSKLQKIADILKMYPERDVLVTGHTALAGTERGRQTLSELRAKTVGDYFFSTGVKKADQIITRGMGARVPVADNTSEEGMRKNRRVEITILEN